jgi:hypothetical protein
MTTRERHMSIVLTGFIIVVGASFFGYQFVYAPIRDKKLLINNLVEDIDQRKIRQARIEKRQPDLEKWKKLSLPPDKEEKTKVAEAVVPGRTPTETARADLAQGAYEDWLNNTLKAAGYALTDVAITPRKPDAKNVPQLSTKKPIYTRVQFSVQLKGDLASLVDFMDRFYKVALLHQIRNLTITKPLGGDFRAAAAAGANGGAPPAPSTDLDVNMTIEALVLDNAEKRATLFPDKPVEVPPLLSKTDAQYAMIPGKNMFFGPLSTREPGERGTGYFDTAPHLFLNGITSGDNGLEATLWDRIHNWDYRITQRRTGGFQVDVEYTLGNRKRPDSERSGRTLALRDSNGTIKDEWLIVRIDPREVVLRVDVTGKYYALHMGEDLSHRNELTKADLEARGIKPEPPKAPPKPSEIDYDNP